MGEEKFKLLVFDDRFPPFYGGGSKQVFSVLKSLSISHSDLFVELCVISARKNKFEENPERIKVNFLHVRKNPFGYMELFAKSLLPASRSSSVLICITSYESLVLAVVAKMLGKKIILRTSLFGYDDVGSIFKNFRFKSGYLFLLLVDKIICNSRIVEKSYILNGHGKKTKYIPNGVDISFFSPGSLVEKRKFRETRNVPQDRIVLVYSGTLSRRKNILLLIDFLEAVKKRNDKCVLFIVGPTDSEWHAAFDKDYFIKIKSSIQKKNLTGDIYFYSFQGYDASIYQMSDIYVSASTAEGMPNAMLEAMACGLPVVALNVDGNLDSLVQNGGNGYLLDTQDPDIFANKICDIMTDENLKNEFSRKSRKIIEDRHSMDKIAGEYFDMLN